MTTTNAPESVGLSPQDNQIFEAGRAACASLAKTFELWVTVARAVELAKTKAERIGTRNAFERILNQQGLAPTLGSSWDSQKATASKLLNILKQLSEIDKWRATLTAAQRINWAAPTTVYKHCPLFKSARDEKEEKDNNLIAALFSEEEDDEAPEETEIKRLQGEILQLKNRIRELEAELAAMRGYTKGVCSYCSKAEGEGMMVPENGDGPNICAGCIDKFTKIIAEQRSSTSFSDGADGWQENFGPTSGEVIYTNGAYVIMPYTRRGITAGYRLTRDGNKVGIEKTVADAKALMQEDLAKQ